MSNALPLNLTTPSAAQRPMFPRPPISSPVAKQSFAPLPRIAAPNPPVPRTMAEKMIVARDRIKAAAEAGQRVRSYEVALDLDLSEFHFARQFRAAWNRSPHVFYDEIRAEKARELLAQGMGEGDVARKVGFRRPAELRALLAKRVSPSTAPAAPEAEAPEASEG